MVSDADIAEKDHLWMGNRVEHVRYGVFIIYRVLKK